LGVDALSIIGSAGLALLLWDWVNPTLEPGYYVRLLPLVSIFLLANALAGLYPGIGLHPAEEFRRIVISTSIAFLCVGTLSFYLRNTLEWSRGAFGVAWFLALFIAPDVRRVVRAIVSHSQLWGEPVAVVGSGPLSARILEGLRKQPQLGLRPYVAIQGLREAHALGEDTFSRQMHESLNAVQTAILVSDEVSPELRHALLNPYRRGFARIIIVSGELQQEAYALSVFDLAGAVGLGRHVNLVSTWQRWAKRAIDLLVLLVSSPLILAALALLGLAIRIDSRGPVFFRQYRLGKDSQRIQVWKFRTMVTNAESVLHAYLNKDARVRAEWEQDHKLKHDPRITRVGHLLRRTSLDELPQVINVLMGEMSLVGPRPIVAEERPLYGTSFDLYQQVLPGLTGLWQVSGRNDLSYPERVRLDEYYVRNWSIWMDFYILQRTIGAVISGKGAY
jgi:Undecaprenyl-phosphate galactose phosphotransferase WbaP